MLISVNPFKQMPYFTDREIELYQGAVRMLRAGWRAWPGVHRVKFGVRHLGGGGGAEGGVP